MTNLTAPHTADEIERMLRDFWEGCLPWREAIEMTGAPKEMRPALRKAWNRWQRHFDASNA